MRPLLSSTVLAVSLALAAGCSSTSDDTPEQPISEEALATAGAKILVRNVEHPDGLAATDKHLYFSTNHFVASGDPELDQEMAYWEGKYSRIPLAGGAREQVDDAGLVRVRQSGTHLFAATGSSCWITSIDTAVSPPTYTPAYDDDQCEEYGPVGFDATSDKLIVVKAEGDVMVSKLDGTDRKKVGAFHVGDTIPFLDATVVANGKVFALTARNVQGQTKQAILSIPISGGTQTKVIEIDPAGDAPANFTGDGKNLYFSQGGKVFALGAGTTHATQIGTYAGTVTGLVSDGTNLVVSVVANGNKQGTLYAIKDAGAASPHQVKVLAVNDIESIAVGNGAIYFGTHVVKNNKNAGVIGSIKMP